MTPTPGLDQLVDSMQSIVSTCANRDSPAGYFPAMYLGVTRAVEQGINDGIFTTPDRLTQLTISFAQRYLDAWNAHESGGRPTESWQMAFGAAAQWRPTVLQHLLLGMNAHINLDLGIAAASVAPGVAIDDLRTDFEQINEVLASLVQTIQRQLGRISPLYRFIDDVGGDTDRAVVNFSIARARDEAWTFATVLAAADPAQARERIAAQDRFVARLGRAIRRPSVVTSTGLLAVRLTERRRSGQVIELLSSATGPPAR
jgi:hypothetical protein